MEPAVPSSTAMQKCRNEGGALAGLASLASLALLAGCGGSSPATHAPVVDGGADAAAQPDGATDAATPPDGATDAAPAVATPITGLSNDAWTWVPFDNAFCRDGSTTGIGVNVHPGATKLMIFLQGGGACFDALTCLDNPSTFGAADFASLMPDGGAASPGVFDRSDPANPVSDWNYVFVPYCTGDVHSGNQPNGMVPGLTTTQLFVGYANIGAFLARIVPTFPSQTQVLLTGVSAGGFGAAANYIHVARAFGTVPVTLFDDSGPMMDSPYVATCLSQDWVQTWALDRTILADCGSDCANDGHFLIDYTKHVVAAYPNIAFGLLESTDDVTITKFFGFGANNCTTVAPLSGDTFTAGLDDIRTKLAAYPNFGEYVFSGTRHTTIENTADFDSLSVGADAGTDAGGVAVTAWMAQILAGHASNVGP
jgi:hypothetical protein